MEIDFVNIPVKDQNRALKFYTEIMGFKLKMDIPNKKQRWIALTVKDCCPYFVLYTSEDQENMLGKAMNFAFRVKDINKTCNDLKSKGVEIVKPPTKEAWGGSSCDIRDSEGNKIMLVEYDDKTMEEMCEIC